LREVRALRGATQEQVARITGIPLKAYRKLERKQIAHPPLAYLCNCALALGVELEDVTEPGWGLEWVPMGTASPTPPHPSWIEAEKQTRLHGRVMHGSLDEVEWQPIEQARAEKLFGTDLES
jgi:transcriptional regulator with XRE-family HTH domain